ncbi:hypothetical protein PR048_016835 [Dryococelus australis]|uniref:Uncharacterized protein n=1 Tax=Dryococelus australis TaxID=614101 RepID=A0ABQ9H7S6_9NEOP|nr:hypothetical protein PR048_016835 [Dryococelus australis]
MRNAVSAVEGFLMMCTEKSGSCVCFVKCGHMWTVLLTKVDIMFVNTARDGGTGDPRENPSTSGIFQHYSQLRKSRVIRPGNEPGSPWWEGSITIKRKANPLLCGATGWSPTSQSPLKPRRCSETAGARWPPGGTVQSIMKTARSSSFDNSTPSPLHQHTFSPTDVQTPQQTPRVYRYLVGAGQRSFASPDGTALLSIWCEVSSQWRHSLAHICTHKTTDEVDRILSSAHAPNIDSPIASATARVPPAAAINACSGGHGVESRSSHPDFGSPRFSRSLQAGECWHDPLLQSMAGSSAISAALNNFLRLRGSKLYRDLLDRPLRKPADQRHRPARFPLEKIWERPRWGRTWFDLTGGERSSHYTTVAPLRAELKGIFEVCNVPPCREFGQRQCDVTSGCTFQGHEARQGPLAGELEHSQGGQHRGL